MAHIRALRSAMRETLKKNPGLDHRSKWSVYQYVRQFSGVVLPELYATVTNGQRFPKLDTLPDRFCLKGDKGEQSWEVLLIEKQKGGVYDWMHKKKYTRHQFGLKMREMIRRMGRLIFEEWLGAGPGGAEETRGAGPGGRIPIDYKVLFVAGQPHLIYAIDRNPTGPKGKTVKNLYDLAWERQSWKRYVRAPLAYMDYDSEADLRPAPELRDRLIEVAREIHRQLNSPSCIRIDLYAVGNQIYFGELTLVCGFIKVGQPVPSLLKLLTSKPQT